MADSRTLKLEILAETKQFIKDMKDGGDTVDSFGDKAEKMGKVVGTAFLAAGAAAAAYAGKLAVDGVKAAIEDEAAQARLAKSLENTTGATEKQVASVEAQISKMSLAYGVADDNLRPAFQRLATATGSVEQATSGLSLALDISAATSKSVESVSNILGKAYEGNTGALAKLGVGLSAADLKSMTLEQTMAKLSDTFGGAATTKAETFQGKLDRLKVGFDEAKESIGFALLPILEKMMTFVNDHIVPGIQKVVDLFSSTGGGLGEKVSTVGKAFKDTLQPIIEGFQKAWEKVSDAIMSQKDNFEAFLATIKPIYKWVNDNLVPLFQDVLVGAVNTAATAISAAIKLILPVANAVAEGVTSLINGIITGINAFIRAYNVINGIIPGAKDLQTIDKIGAPAPLTGGNTVPSSSLPFGGSTGSTGGGSTSNQGGGTGRATSGGGATGGGTGSTSTPEIDYSKLSSPSLSSSMYNYAPTVSGSYPSGSSLYNPNQPSIPIVPVVPTPPAANQAALNAGLTIVVNAPSAIDQQGFTNAVVDALNQAERRGTGGASRLAVS